MLSFPSPNYLIKILIWGKRYVALWHFYDFFNLMTGPPSIGTLIKILVYGKRYVALWLLDNFSELMSETQIRH